jgi:PAS domain S-box-containing protein
MLADGMANSIAKRLVESNLMGIFSWNLEGVITEANEAFLGVVQYDREDLASGRLRMRDLSPSEWCDRDQHASSELKARGIFKPYQREFFRKDGSRVPVLFGGAFSENSKSEGVAFILDLSEQKNEEQTVWEGDMKLQQMLDFTPHHLAIYGHGRERIFANRTLLNYLGLRLEEWQSRDPQTRFHPDDFAKLQQHTADYEARLRRHDGTYRWFLIRNNPVRDERGQTICWCVAGTDIEDRKQTEQLQVDLTHANRVSTMGELVASLSHELAQPIQITTAHAKASLRWLERDPPDVMEARKGTEKIIEAGGLASEIISRLRSLYKKAPPKLELVSINEVIGEIVKLMEGEASDHGVSLRVDLEDNLPRTLADRVQLQQVLMNLILNGVEAMKDSGGVITAKSHLRGDGQIQISVHDTGAGLPPGKADQIFDAFFTTKLQGSGMGLAVCKSIVESQGGRIWAGNDGGPGATFHFTLPVASDETSFPVMPRD